jgi:methylated-DNA-protein-cysteine methyltransferase-like protein
MEDVTQLMLLVIRQIPAGRVATYGQVARLSGRPQNARQVGATLRNLPSGSEIPWHRVVNARGVVSRRTQQTGCEQIQAELLEAEGVVFDSRGRIDLQQFLWDPADDSK